MDTVRWAWRTRVIVHLSIDLRMRLWQGAEDEAVRVFAANLRDLLLAPPAGTRPVLGLDPGLRTGVKVAVVDATGKVVATETIYPHEPWRRWDEAVAVLARLARAHRVELVAIGNGTASRETDKLAGEVIKLHPELGLTKIMVSEAGASVYSASAYASRELPGLDVSLRGAASIARRLQDPLAELVKIDPKSIGVGQYQHDLSDTKLSRSLDAVVEDCVNAVGVDVNTASAPLLARVSGISDGLAVGIVAHRDGGGPFRSRRALKAVPRLGPKAFEQCARLPAHPRWRRSAGRFRSAPEAYPVVRRILAATGSDIMTLIGNTTVLRALKPVEYADDTFGIPTVTDILGELENPAATRVPPSRRRRSRRAWRLWTDLRPGMVLEGVVTNVAAFGAFVDVGVHQDGLVHISAMSKSFVADPREVVKPGNIVRVKVLSIDIARKRVALTLRLDDEARDQARGSRGRGGPGAAEAGKGSGGSGSGGSGSGGWVRAAQALVARARVVQAVRARAARGKRAAQPQRGDRAQGQGSRSGQPRQSGSDRDRGGSTGRAYGAGSGRDGEGALANALRRAGLVDDSPDRDSR